MSRIDIQYIQTVEYSVVGEAAKKKQSGPTLINTARPSLCPIDQLQQWRAACLLLSVPQAGDINRQRQAPGAQQQRRRSTGPLQQTRAVSRLQLP